MCQKDSRCVTAAFCGGDTCFMKDRTAGPEKANAACNSVITQPDLVNNPWIPNDPGKHNLRALCLSISLPLCISLSHTLTALQTWRK